MEKNYDYKQKNNVNDKLEKLTEIQKSLSSINIETNNDKINNAKEQLDDFLNRSKALLDLKQKYNVIFLGASGKGKSTILNVLMGRDLFPVGELVAITGTIITIEAKEDNKPETALVHCSEPEDLKIQVEELISLGKLTVDNTLTDIFDLDHISEEELFSRRDDWLHNLKVLHTTTENPEQKRYIAAVWDIVNSYILNYKALKNKTLFGQYLIPEQLEELSRLINEKDANYDDSKLDENADHKIRLISHVTYRVDPSKSKEIGRLLEHNICVVDVPGFGEKNPLHEIITKNYFKHKEPMFVFVAYTETRLFDSATIQVLRWLDKNYVAIARKDPELLRTLAECILLVVNNGKNVIDNKTKVEIDKEIEKEIYKYIDQEYWFQSKGIEQDATPYILVTPSPAAYLNKQCNGMDESKLKRYYEEFSESLNIDQNLSFSEKEKIIYDNTGIPFLTNEISYFLKNRRVNIQIYRAHNYLKLGLNELVNAIKPIVSNYEFSDPNAWAIKELNMKYEGFQEQLKSIQDKLFASFGEGDKPVKLFVDHFNNPLNETKENVKNVIEMFDIEEYIKLDRGHISGNKWVQSNLPELGNKIDYKIHEHFVTSAEKCADRLIICFNEVLNKKEIKSQMTDVTYGKEYCHKIDEEYESHIKVFRKEYTKAFKILMINELLRQEKCLAYFQLKTLPTTNNNSDKDSEVKKIKDKLKELTSNIEGFLDATDRNPLYKGENPLFKGLRAHFFYLYFRLQNNLNAEYRYVIQSHQSRLSTEQGLVEKILETNSKYHEQAHLLHTYNKLVDLQHLLDAVHIEK